MKLKPMDTAPRDGTRILIWEEGGHDKWVVAFWGVYDNDRPGGYAWCIDESWDSEWGIWHYLDAPRYWLPLPPAPEV